MWWETWAGNAGLTAGCVLTVWMARGVGLPVLRRLLQERTGHLEEFVLSVGLGLGILSLALLGLGAAGLYRPVSLAALCAVMAAAAWRAGIPTRIFHPKGSPSGEVGGDERLFVLALVSGWLAMWLAALSPPIFYDALVYHLGVPRLYLLRSGIEYLPGVVHSNFPFVTEMLHLFGLWLGGPRLATLLNFTLALLSALALFALVERRWGRWPALVATLFYSLNPMMFLLSRYASSETAMSLFFILCFACLFRRHDGGGVRWVVLAGIFGGLTYGTKYVGGLFGIALPLFLIAAGFFGPGGVKNRRRGGLLLFSAGALAAAFPWMLKNAVFTGNPFFPTFSVFFGAESWSGEQGRLLARSAHALWEAGAGLRDLLLLPLRLAMASADFGAASKPSLFWPLSLIAAGVLLWKGRERGERPLALAFLLYFLLWSLTFWMARFLLPASALGAAALALVLLRAAAWSPLSARGVAAAVLVLLALNTAAVVGDVPTRKTFAPALGMQEGEEYLRSRLRSYPVIEHINDALPSSARILVIGETRVAYLERDFLFNTAFDRSILDGAAVGETLAARGVTHVLVNLRELGRLQREGWWPAWRNGTIRDLFEYLDDRGRLLMSGNGVFLYDTTSRDSTLREQTP